MENQVKEKLDTHDQVLDQLITQVEILEKRDYPDYKQSTADLKQAALDLKKGVSEVKLLVGALPKVLPVKHEHAFDVKTKGVIIGAAIWAVFTCLLIGLNISQDAENTGLKANSLKYRMIRQTYPVQADWADSAYRANPERMEKITGQLEEQAEASSHARDLAGQKEREAEAARENAKVLKKKSTRSRKEALSGGRTNN